MDTRLQWQNRVILTLKATSILSGATVLDQTRRYKIFGDTQPYSDLWWRNQSLTHPVDNHMYGWASRDVSYTLRCASRGSHRSSRSRPHISVPRSRGDTNSWRVAGRVGETWHWQSWRDSLDATVLTRQSWCDSLDVTVLTWQSWLDSLDVTVVTRQSWLDSLDVTVLTWQYRCGSLDTAVSTWQSPRGSLDVTAVTWQSWHDSLDPTVLTRQYWPDSIDVAVLTWQSWSDSLDMTVLTWQSWHDSLDTTVLMWQSWRDSIGVTVLTWQSWGEDVTDWLDVMKAWRGDVRATCNSLTEETSQYNEGSHESLKQRCVSLMEGTTNERKHVSLMEIYDSLMERGSSVVECRTRSQASPGSNPSLLPFRRLGIFVLSIDAPVHSAV